MLKREARNLRRNNSERKPRLEIPDCSGQTAWVIGAGTTLNEIWNWKVPDNVTMFYLNSGIFWAWGRWLDNEPIEIPYKRIANLEDYRNPVDYWFCIDPVVTTKTYHPEWEYANIALKHPTAKKIIMNGIYYPPESPNVLEVQMKHDWQAYQKFVAKNLMRGPTVLIPCLSFIHLCGFKNVILSGIDFCRYMYLGDEERRFFDRLSVKKNHEHGDKQANIYNERRDTNGDVCYQEGMMRNHMNASMSLIRAMQNEGRNFFKTSLRGMCAIPAITDNAVIQAIVKGKKLCYRKC